MGIHPRLPGLISDREPHEERAGTPVVSDAATAPSRRGFIARMAAGGAALTVGSQLLPFTRLAVLSGAQEGDAGAAEVPERVGDELIVAFLASVGLAGASAYRAAVSLEAVTLSEPVVEVLQIFGAHHSQQAAALNSLLTVAVEEPNASLAEEQVAILEAAGDEAAVLSALAELEDAVAATHMSALAELEAQSDAALVAQALPVCAQHALVLGSLNGGDIESLLPETQTDEGALTAAQYPLVAAEGGDSTTTTAADGASSTTAAEDGGSTTTTTTDGADATTTTQA